MNQRTLGRTGLTINPLALGTVELGMDYGINAPGHFGRPSEEAALRLVHAALDAGINLIDTARGYGESEAVLGKALRDRRHQVVLATKCSTRLPDGSKPDGAELRQLMLSQLETSLRLLQTDFVDLWQLHYVDENELGKAETLAEVFSEVKQSGKVRWVGGSFYGAEMPAAALELDLFDTNLFDTNLFDTNLFDTNLFDTIQVTYSVFDQRLADQVFALAEEKNVGVIVRSVLLKGALTERADHLPDHLEELRARSRQFRQLVADSGVKLDAAQVALAFALAQPQIDAVLMGVRTIEEMEHNLIAAEAVLPAHFIEELAALRIDDEMLINPGKWGIP